MELAPTFVEYGAGLAQVGCRVERYFLHQAQNFDLDERFLSFLEEKKPEVVFLCNPNNPTGALMSQEMLEEIVAIARRHGAYILCDEVYRHLTQEEGYCPSIVDLYEKGISVSSMSKVFSLAGVRLGWIASRDPEVLERCLIHRDYDLISCGLLDETVAALALKHGDKLLARNRGIVRENLSILDSWVRKEPHVSYVKPQAGTTALVYYDLDIPSYDFCKEMYHACLLYTSDAADD